MDKKNNQIDSENNYVPCGEEWKKNVTRMKKDHIVNLFANVCKERTELRKLLTEAVNGFGQISISNRDNEALNKWKERCKKTL